MNKKDKARYLAINWQNNFSKKSYSWQGIINWQNRFLKIAKKYNLVKEFKENGII